MKPESNAEFPDIGFVLDSRYELGEELGRGGMAKVFLAYDCNLQLKVALKILSRRFYWNEEFIKRFRTEAHAAARLKHQNIVGVYNVGYSDDWHFISMEHVPGETLEDIIAKKENFFDPKEVCEIVCPVLSALAYAHKVGIIHRDIKPTNIIIDDAGAVKITDFGIAKLTEPGEVDTAVTQAGDFIGTVLYYSPEQAKGEELDGKTDVFSLGQVMYKLLASGNPFNNTIYTPFVEALDHIKTGRLIPPRKRNSSIPSALEDILLKMLAHNPNDRYDAEEALYDLTAFLEGQKVSVKGARRRRFNAYKGKYLITISLLTALAAIAIGTPIHIVKKQAERVRQEQLYQLSLYSEIDSIQAAQSWEEMVPLLGELEAKLYDWVLERADRLKLEGFPVYYKDSSVDDLLNPEYGVEWIGSIYGLGYCRTRNVEFIELFKEFYDAMQFHAPDSPNQYNLQRFKIDKELLELLSDQGFPELEDFREKQRRAIQYLIEERYHPAGFFLWSDQTMDETADKWLLYPRTQYNTMPLLVDGFSMYDVETDFGITPSEYLTFIVKHTRTSNKYLLGEDFLLPFGMDISLSNQEPPKPFSRKVEKVSGVYVTKEIAAYIIDGLYPVVRLFDELENDSIHREAIPDISFKQEQARNIVNIYRSLMKHVGEDGLLPYYIPMTDSLIPEFNPHCLKSSLLLLRFVVEELNNPLISDYLSEAEIEKMYVDRFRMAKAIFTRDNFNSEYSFLGVQSFLDRAYVNPQKPKITSSGEAERNLVRLLSEIK